MSFRAIFNDEFDRLTEEYVGDLAEDITYTHVGYSGDYNYTTHTIGISETTETVKGLFGRFSIEQQQMENIAPEDVKFTFSVKSYSFVPETNDTITKGSNTYQVVKVDNVAFNSLWVLQLRATA